MYFVLADPDITTPANKSKRLRGGQKRDAKKSGMVWVVSRGMRQRDNGDRLVTLRETFAELLDICRQVKTRGWAAMLNAIKQKGLAITRYEYIDCMSSM